MVREKSGKSQGILLYSNCGHPVNLMAKHVVTNLSSTYILHILH